MHLNERLLEDVVRRRGVAEEAQQEVVQLALVPVDEHRERVPVAAEVGDDELLVGAGDVVAGLIHKPCLRVPMGLFIGPVRSRGTPYHRRHEWVRG